MPAFKIEFYKPRVVNPRGVSFADLLDRIVAMNAVERIRGGNDPAAVLTLHHQGQEYVGEAARIRMEDLPTVIDTANGNRHDLNVGANEGLGEEIHFLYDAPLDVLAVQSKLHFRASALEQLISDLTHTGINLHIILRSDAWERFQRMDSVTKVSFTLARPQDIHGQRPAVMRVFREIDEFDGVSAMVEITVGRKRNRFLSMEAVQRLVADFRAQGAEFKDLSITGAIREAEAEEDAVRRDTIDFLKERLQVEYQVERRGRGRRLDVEGCRLALRRGLRENREYLRRYMA